MDRDRSGVGRGHSGSRGRSPRPAVTPPHHYRNRPNGADGSFSDDPLRSGDGMPHGRGRNSHLNSRGRFPRDGADGSFSDDTFRSGDGMPLGRGRNSHPYSRGRFPRDGVDGSFSDDSFRSGDGMSHGSGRNSHPNSQGRFPRDGADGSFSNDSFRSGDGMSHGSGRNSHPNSRGRCPREGADGSFSDDNFGSGDGMSHGRGRNSHPISRGRFPRDGADDSFFGDSFRIGNGMLNGRGRNVHSNSRGSFPRDWDSNRGTPQHYQPKKKVLEVGVSHEERLQKTIDGVLEQCESSVGSNSVAKDDFVSMSGDSSSQNLWLDLNIRIQMGQTLREGAVDGATTLHADLAQKVNIGTLQNESQPPLHSGAKDKISHEKFSDNTANTGESGHPEQGEGICIFDICLTRNGTPVMLKPSLLVKNREKRNEKKRAAEGLTGKILRPGMVLLKNYLSVQDQAKIVKQCRDVGIGPGGFYQPGYRDGGRMHLQMMCLGRNWDPDRSEYVEIRPIDGAKAPILPNEFHLLVKKAIKDSHALIERDSNESHVEDFLPFMSPNICVVNFYKESGRLGLHQDKDESPGSLRKGLPVVSFSIGDSGEFLFSDQRDVEKAEKVLLESGDVLIFGGKSRLIFHGVSHVLQNTAPKVLLDETNLRPGRLNLTFREY